ncbi:ubiquinone biosynthesis protein COQ9-A, mitochondrial-like [Anneissia japonica]|uniref:ubiquinone biosynthesis protein COQ9-A, mitochondrial-like n=1 Tax=Anneissia japonica TaxID=1529436 RepID=UPI00142593E7|nr:ubiquinone biosynthesis protein COQ9-A, mitochondrial-like [Anneissia japonica]
MLKNLTRLRPVVLNLARPRQIIVKTTLSGNFNKVGQGLCRLISVRYCHNEKTSSPNNTDTETDSSNHDSAEEETITEDDIKAHILVESLNFVETHGWSIEALAEGAKAVGYPGVAHGMFERAGGDLVHYFVAQCNKSLAERLAKDAKETEENPDLPNRKVSQIIRDAIEMRLRMIIPYVKHWPQAMALTAVPSNTIEHFKNLSKLMDDIWYYAGDNSADVSKKGQWHIGLSFNR